MKDSPKLKRCKLEFRSVKRLFGLHLIGRFFGYCDTAGHFSSAADIIGSDEGAPGTDNITFVGHSLGGGLAQAAALATNGSAMTYNPAWLSNSTISNNNLNSSNGRINNYIVYGDLLDAGQTAVGSYLGLQHLGHDHYNFDFEFKAIKVYHLIDSEIDALDNAW